jgi:AraC-like DNA-binding protein
VGHGHGLEPLRDRVAAAVEGPTTHAAVPGVTLHIARGATLPVPVLFRPTVYIVLQGAKRLVADDREVVYRAGQLVTLSVGLPALVEVVEASPSTPYLSLEMAIDRRVLGELAARSVPGATVGGGPIAVRPVPDSVLGPALRLVELLPDVSAADVLAEGVKREVLYRVLTEPGGADLVSLVQAESTLSRIGSVADWMHDNLGAPLAVEDLARRAGTSAATFHRGFRAATGTTPGRYHKLLRLYEARRLVAMKADTLSGIATSVGYASASQFSRDYRRMFGLSPARDADRLASPPDAPRRS